jgi:NAD(P)H-quinone oxidoreductase subunit 5
MPDPALTTTLLAHPWGVALGVALAAPVLLFALAALFALFPRSARVPRRLSAPPEAAAAPAWRVLERAALAALVAAAAALAAVAAHGPASGAGLRADLPGALVAALVAFVGWVIVRAMRTGLDGEPGARAAAGWLAATLAAVSVVLAADHLLLLAAAWIATSLALQRLLLYFDRRPAARVAAHKKRLFSGLADACMVGAVALLAWQFGTLSIGALLAQASAAPVLAPAAQAAMLLVVVAALLKCAQLPFHGWLIQVMEAPTPVSALLHAGVVNLGGFVLIRLHPMLAEAPLALAVLAAVATATTVVAALVMATRVSVKVMLAWSTAAQMGFMLLQVALGLPEMALLHLLAHSLVKAYAFLGAGGVVRAQQLRRLAPAPHKPTAARWLAAVLAGVATTAAAGLAWGVDPGTQPALWLMAGIVALAQLPLWLGAPAAGGGAMAWRMAGVASAAALPLAYFGLHALFARVVPVDAAGAPAGALLLAVGAAFVVLHAVQAMLLLAPQGAPARRLYPWCYGGLFLDEAVSRIAFRLSPPRLPCAVTPRPSLAPLTPVTPAAPATPIAPVNPGVLP